VHRGNTLRDLRRIAQRLAQLANGDAHDGITDGHLGPERVQQHVFGDQAVRMDHEVVKDVKGFGGYGYSLSLTPQTDVIQVEAGEESLTPAEQFYTLAS
jgi:hypothetical protein